MSPSVPLPIHGQQPPPQRRDAQRNREVLLAAAALLVERDGVPCVTMDAIAAQAGVGKGTLFRHFESRAGLMGALLDRSESAWQAEVISGPPPLGPDAEPLDRLLAFGRSRVELNLVYADLIVAAGGVLGAGSHPANAFSAMHVRLLLTALHVSGDIPVLATALLAPLEVVILRQQVTVEHLDPERIIAGWTDLVRRVTA